MIAETEDGELARRFLRESISKHGINPDTLTLHAAKQIRQQRATVLTDAYTTPRTVRPRHPTTTETAQRRLDQPTERGGDSNESDQVIQFSTCRNRTA